MIIKNSKIIFFLIIFILLIFYVNFFQNKNNLDNSIKTIQFSSWGSQSEVEIIKPILNEFEKKNPDIKIEFIHIPQNYFQKIHLLFASNLAPDVIFINNLYLPVYANAGLLKPFNINLKSDINFSDFFEKSVQALSFNDEIYAVPRDVSNLVIYYNKDLFNKYNVKLPNKYWTFSDLLNISKKLTIDTNGDGKTDIWGISFEDTPALFYLPYLMSEGGGILSDDSKTLIFNSDKSQKGLKFYSNLRNKYHVAPTKAESASETMAQLFLQEKLAMHLSGRWLVPKYKSDASFDWGVITFPSGEAGSVVPLDASGWAISKNSKNISEAVKLVEFLSSKESIEKLCKSGLIVPARKDVAKGIFMQSNHNSFNNKAFLDAIQKSKPTPVSIDYNQILDNLENKTDYIFNSVSN